MPAQSVFEGFTKLLHERRLEAKTQQGETAREATQQQQREQEEVAREARQQQQREQEEATGEAEQQQQVVKRDKVVREKKRQTSQEEKRVGFGRYMERTFGEVYSQDNGFCEWVAPQETTNIHMIECGRFIQ